MNFTDYETICAFTGFLYFFTKRPIGIIVSINSLFYHLSNAFGLESTLFLKSIDIICNIVFCIYGLCKTKWIPQAYIITLLVFILWNVNRYTNYSNIIHIIGVQLPLLICYLKM